MLVELLSEFEMSCLCSIVVESIHLITHVAAEWEEEVLELHSVVSWLHELGCSPVLSWIFGSCSATTLIIAPDGFVESDELSNKYINFIYRLLSAYQHTCHCRCFNFFGISFIWTVFCPFSF